MTQPVHRIASRPRAGARPLKRPHLHRRRIVVGGLTHSLDPTITIGPSFGGGLTSRALGSSVGDRFAEWIVMHGTTASSTAVRTRLVQPSPTQGGRVAGRGSAKGTEKWGAAPSNGIDLLLLVKPPQAAPPHRFALLGRVVGLVCEVSLLRPDGARSSHIHPINVQATNRAGVKAKLIRPGQACRDLSRSRQTGTGTLS